MSIVSAFFKLIRWPNLVFIALTQMLFRFFILPFVYKNNTGYIENIRLPLPLFYCVVFASVCIAAAGYIINDYFDVNIDLINKPAKLIVDRYIKRRWTIVWHIALSFIGLAISCYVGYKLRNFYIPLFNFAAIVALWFYSTTFKNIKIRGRYKIQQR